MGSTQNDNGNNNGCVSYQAEDDAYFGAVDVIQEELTHIAKRRQKLHGVYNSDNLACLALSGGGIRSASFCLGVLQALSYRNVLKKIDYLSTVSGGGYIGSSLTWLLSQPWKKKTGEEVNLGVDQKNFPYGTYPMLGQAPISGEKSSEFNKGIAPRHRGSLLRYLRQHGKYLTPGHGINGMSLLGVILRGAILSISIYFSVLVLLMTFLLLGKAFQPITVLPGISGISSLQTAPNILTALGIAGLTFFVVCAPIYSFLAYRQSKRKNKETSKLDHQEDGVKIDKIETRSYKMRRRCEIIYNYLLTVSALLIVFGLIPEIHQLLSSSGSGDFMAGLTGAISTAIGFISSISAYIKTGSNKKGIVPISLLVLVGTIALWFGLLLLAYHCSDVILNNDGKWIIIALLAAYVVFIGLKANLNYISVHRYYRDRLMETFMPDVPEVLDPEETPQQATEQADKARLSQMCGYGYKETKDPDSQQQDASKQRKSEDNEQWHPLCMPYHIINTNLVLVSSKKAKFKGRGGDNFILSPAYCGSNATGWQKTSQFMDDRMTLPTAMAISGAAVNPSTGVGGDGMTRQPFLSMLMGLLNIRLGYWAPNPCLTKQSKVPNFLLPGFFEMFFRKQLEEKSEFLQLSDGGHFENLGIYELIRRKASIIIACDAAADPTYEFTDLSNALEKIRADFGVLVEIPTHQLEAMVPRRNSEFDKTQFARKGFIVADILYPDREPGKLIYMKSTFFRALSADLYGYKQTHREFPDEPTSDQFFDEKQFEAYRELGYQTAWQMMNHNSVRSDEILGGFFKQ